MKSYTLRELYMVNPLRLNKLWSGIILKVRVQGQSKNSYFLKQELLEDNENMQTGATWHDKSIIISSNGIRGQISKSMYDVLCINGLCNRIASLLHGIAIIIVVYIR